MRRRYRLWPELRGCSRWRWGVLQACFDRMAYGSRAAQSPGGCRSSCRRHRRWPYQPWLPHLYFQHRCHFMLCFCYQTYRCLGTGHFSSPRPSSRDRRNSWRCHCSRRTSPRCRRSWLRSSSRWRGPGSEPLSCLHLHYPTWFLRQGGQSLEWSCRARRGLGTEPAAIGSDQSC